MSDTDGGAPNRPGSASGSGSGGSGTGESGSSGSGSTSTSSTSSTGSKPAGDAKGAAPKSSGNDTRPLKTAGPGGSGGPGSSGGSGSKGSSGAPAAAAKKTAAAPGKPGGKPGTAVATKQGPGKGVARPTKAAAPRQRPAGPVGRRVRLTVSRIDPWSTMKLSFLLSVALGIALVVMAFVLWTVLNSMGVFDQINNIAGNLFPVDDGQPFDLMDYIGLGKVMSLAIVVGVIDVILITAIATLSAFLYNLSSSLVGGLQLTLTDD